MTDATTEITSGTTSIGLMLGNGDILYVDSGGTVSSTIVGSGANDYIFRGAVATSDMINGNGEYALSGGIVNDAIVGSGGYEYVFSGGTANNATIESGGVLRLFGGAITSGTIFDGGTEVLVKGYMTSGSVVAGGALAYLVVSSGVNTSRAVIDSGGTEVLSSGGTATGTIVNSGGTIELLDGATATSTIISSGGVETVSSGGTTRGTVVDSGGSELLLSGGVASGTIVNSGGFEILSSGATATGTVVDSGGTIELLDGATATGTIFNGGVEVIASGYVAINTPVYGSGFLGGGTLSSLIVADGGIANSTLIVGSGTEIVLSGGIANSTQIGANGTETVSSGGIANSTQVTQGGIEIVSAGGTASATLVGSGGVEIVSSGGAASATVVSRGGVETVSSGGAASATVVGSGGVEIVSAGGTASATVVSSGGVETVSAGGTTISTVASYLGTEIVSAGGTAISTTVSYLGAEIVSSGGATSSTRVSYLGTETVLFSGTAISTMLSYLGVEIVSSGGVASSTLVNYEGVEEVLSGGTALSAVVSNGGTETVSTGGTAIGTIVGSGGFEIVSGGITHSTVIRKGATETVASGGTAIGTVVNSGGTETVSAGGNATSSIIATGGTETVSSGGGATGTIVNSGGFEIVSAGGNATGTVINNGGFEVVSAGGNATGSVIGTGGTETVSSGAAATGTVVNSGGFEIVSAGGNATGTVIGTGGCQIVSSGGAASGTVVDSGGTLELFGGAIATGAIFDGGTEIAASGYVLSGTVVAGGALTNLIVSSGGSVASAVIGSRGFETVSSGGTATGTVVGSGGTETVSSGGSSISSIVGKGGFQAVSAGGTASGAIVGSGGTEYVFSGGTASSTVIDSGAAEYVYSGGTATGAVVGSGGTEYIYSGSMVAGTMLLSGGLLDLASVAYTSGGTATLDAATDILTVVEDGVTTTVQLAGDYTGEYFHLSSDVPVIHASKLSRSYIAPHGTDVVADGTPCYCRGTLILTEHGDVAVEQLQIGDRLVTRSGQARPLRWIGTRSYSGRFAAGNRDVLPVLIRRHALADNVPLRDLFVSPLHAMYLDDVLIPAAALVNGVSILQIETIEQVEYFHLELDTHDVILAEGAPAESFIDDNSRGMFHNAAGYRLLYPHAAPVPVRFCAPRLEDGEQLELIRRRLLGRAAPARAGEPASPSAALEGWLDEVGHNRISGWARDAATGQPVRLRILDNGVPIAEVVADCYRADLQQAGIGDGRYGFELTLPNSLSPFVRHVIQVRHVSDGQELGRSPWVVEPLTFDAAVEPQSARMCNGHLDRVTRDRIVGWAQDGAHPDQPVALRILDNGVLIQRTVANAFRADLLHAGLGNGRLGFDIQLPENLSSLTRHVIQVCCETDGAELAGSPVTIETTGRFDADLERSIARAVASLAAEPDQTRVLSFMLAQVDQLRQQAADREAGRDARLASRRKLRREGPAAAASPVPGLRALVLDERVPVAGRDAGSAAILSHMQALRQLGYAVSFMAVDEPAADRTAVGTLEASGIVVCRAPFYASVEEVLHRQADCFDVVYLHRARTAARYLTLARQHLPRARILYGVADLQHVRLERQAVIEDRPELLALSRRRRLEEFTAAWSADAVLTHSTDEHALLRHAVPEAHAHHVPWHIPVGDSATPFTARHGIAFVGNYAHAPNLDAARWLVETVMPIVWATCPQIECLLVGADMPAAIHALARPGVHALGHVASLADDVLDRVRLTVAPLRFGAGVKGKVLDSLAAGTPCVMSTIAAEGLPLPAALRALVGPDAASLAALVCRLHENQAAWGKAARAGMSFVRRNHGAAIVRATLLAAIEDRSLATTGSRRGAGG